MQRFRVECNFGCRYFQDIDKAQRYFNKCVVRHLDVELWLVSYIRCVGTEKCVAVQELLAFSGTCLIKG